jgi:hypothetical protein
MTQSGETKNNADLQKAFAELKDSLRHAVDPANDQAPKLGGAVLDAPPATIRPAAPGISSGLRAQTRDMRESESKTSATAEAGRRRKLLYLSAVVVISGLTALGWTLTRGHGTNDPEIEAAATPATDVVETSAAAPGDANAATPAETATTEPEAPAAETARVEPSPMQSPEPENAATPAAATETIAPAQPRVAEPPQGAQTEAVPAQPLAQPAAITPPAATTAAPKSAPAKQAALSPATAAPETEAAKPTVAKPKPVRPKAVTKPKPATQAARRPATEPAPVAPPPAAPVAAEASPPPPPAQNDGAFGFMKRTVNSVGSTLTNIGRGAMGN